MARHRAVEKAFKAAITESWRKNGRAQSVEQGADMAWKVAQPFIDAGIREGMRWAMEVVAEKDLERTHG